MIRKKNEANKILFKHFEKFKLLTTTENTKQVLKSAICKAINSI